MQGLAQPALGRGRREEGGAELAPGQPRPPPGWLQVRNAQIAALWDELHTRQPWRNALGGGGGALLAPFGEEHDGRGGAGGRSGNGTRLLAFFGINTVRGGCLPAWKWLAGIVEY